MRWFDEKRIDDGAFTASTLPQALDAYVRYLDNVLAFVLSRSRAIAAATDMVC